MLPQFDEIISANKQKMFEFAFRMFKNPADAEDIAQKTFIRTHKSYRNLKQEADIYPALCRICLDLCIEKNRAKKFAENQNTTEQILKAISSLPEKYSRLIILKDIGGFSYEEIEKILDFSKDEAGAGLISARDLLKEKIKGIL